MFRRILVANRGEIALRVIRACKEMGIETVAVYSEVDRAALYLRLADETICIGPGSSKKSYLDIPSIVSAAEIADVEAIHPGYGFLSENAHFAEVCQSCNIKFIGPDPETIAAVSNKIQARALAMRAGVPSVPGSGGPVGSEEEALRIAAKIGYPVIVKAAAGGGGRGLRISHNDISLVNGFHAARSEALAVFKDESVYLEKYLERPRHVEFQILGDREGRIIHLGERDCSLQRRNQKLVEEAPSTALDSNLRDEMGRAAFAMAKAAKYHNAGTVEFLLDRGGKFYFMEVNARIQVEHPVTEMVTGIDLIKEQIRLAAGEPLGRKQEEVRIQGHAIECRINAEDPEDAFKPSPGRITAYAPPGGGGVRLDSHVYSGYEVPADYDSMVAKLIVHRANRREAISTMRRALDEYVFEGVKTTIPLHRKIFSHPDFLFGDVDTGFIEHYFSLSD